MVTAACEVADVGRSTVYDRRDHDPQFARQWADIVEQTVELMEREAFRRAVVGVNKPMTVAGEREVVREHSDRLLIFLLRARRPDIYGDRMSSGTTAGSRARSTSLTSTSRPRPGDASERSWTTTRRRPERRARDSLRSRGLGRRRDGGLSAVRVTLSDLGAAADGILAVLADEAARTGNKRWLERALVTGDILGGREPIDVPVGVRNAIANILTPG